MRGASEEVRGEHIHRDQIQQRSDFPERCRHVSPADEDAPHDTRADQGSKDQQGPEEGSAEQAPIASARDLREPAQCSQRQKDFDRGEREGVVDVQPRLVAREVRDERIARAW